MNLYYLNAIVRQLPEFARAAKALSGQSGTRINLNVPEPAYGIIAASVLGAVGRPVLFLSAHPELARRRYEQIKLWLPDGHNVDYFPEVDLLADKKTPDAVVTSERLRILSLLSNCVVGEEGGLAPLIVTSALSLAGKSVAKTTFASVCFDMRAGQHIKQAKFLEKIQSIGYEHDEIVELPGTFGKRGGIVDIFPAGRELPVRLEFFGDEIESIREFDPRTQVSTAQLPAFSIAPAIELSATGNANILDYLPEDAIVLIEDAQQVEAEIERIEQQAVDLRADDEVQGSDREEGLPYFTWAEIAAKLANCTRSVELKGWGADSSRSSTDVDLPFEHAPNYAARFSAFMENLADLRRESNRILIVSMQADRVREMFSEQGIETHPVQSLEGLPPPGALTLVQGSVDGGWKVKGELLLLTDLELFGIVKQRRSSRPRPVRHHWFLNDFSVGDLVVHVEHGIGRFAGVTRRTSEGVEREYLILEYSGGDTLYVPVEQVDRVSLYIGGGERTPALSRLGSQEWNRARQRVKQSVENIAGELIELYASRDAGSGVAFSRIHCGKRSLRLRSPTWRPPTNCRL